MDLQSFFKDNPFLALGFSGGVDSSFLLYKALSCGADIKPYFIKTVFQPEFELSDARRMAAELDVELNVLELDVLNTDISANPENRCYYCKNFIFKTLSRLAAEEGRTLIDGSNASDDPNDRPGMRALIELSVRSPLMECALTKADIRRLSKEAGLFTWNKPAYACLATRIPCGQPITQELLKRIECAEDALFAMGFNNFRVRVFSGAARLQFTSGQVTKAFEYRNKILSALKQYFPIVLLDLEEREP